jgi:hypothetical protein
VLTDCRICEPVVSLQENTRPRDVFGFGLTSRNEPFERSPFFIREINNVLLSSPSYRCGLRDLKLASLSLKLHSVSAQRG